MKYKFDKNEINLLVSILNNLTGTDKKIMQGLISKMKNINKVNSVHSKLASTNILELRKTDKLYARSNLEVQKYFNAKAKRISKYIASRNTYEARVLYEHMLCDAKLPKYEEQFNKALKDYLSDTEIKFLNKEGD